MTGKKPLRLPPEKDTPTETLSQSPFQHTSKTLPRTPPPTTRSKTVSHLLGIQALAETNSNERVETPGKKRKKDETRSPVIVQPLSSSVPETSTNNYPNYYTFSIKKTNGQSLSKDRIMQIREAVFLITKVNFELVKQFVVTNCSKERPGSIVTKTLKNGILIPIAISKESHFNAGFKYISFIKFSLTHQKLRA